MVKHLFLFSLLFITSFFCEAQKDTALPLVRTIKTEVVSGALDNLDNIYLLTANDQLKKYNSHGDSVAVNNNVRRFGKLHSIDVSNPLKLVLFYKDFSNIVVLDRLLTLRTAIDLRQHNILQATAVGLSYDNNFWIFDAVDNKLKKLDEQGSLLLETADLRNVFSNAITPEKIWDRDGLVYLYDPAAGLFAFDYYGTFKRKYPIINWTNVGVMGRYIFGMEKKLIHIFDTATLLEKNYFLPGVAPAAQQYIISNNKLLALTKDAAYLYLFRL
ncbi:MAG: hypothetical protein ICV81_03185 [Flavisolibacter sp.]|nr:hypothetical protein [Flavisolibacter sp.]